MMIAVPTINDEPEDFDALFRMWHQVNDLGVQVTFDFSHCGFLRQNAVAFLGGLARLVQFYFGSVSFAWHTLRPAVRTNLAQNGFLRAFGGGEDPWPGNSIPYREDHERTKDLLTEYLKTMWLGQDWVHISPAGVNAIVGRVWEIYENAFEHGSSPIGVFSCGQYYPRLCMLKLTVLDFGVGIPSNVRIFCRTSNITAANALRWAFRRGTTTKPNGTGRGLGLDLLKEFVQVNQGRLEVFSHDGYALIGGGEERYEARQSYFEGTLINITLRCDERYYQLAGEAAPGPLF